MATYVLSKVQLPEDAQRYRINSLPEGARQLTIVCIRCTLERKAYDRVVEVLFLCCEDNVRTLPNGEKEQLHKYTMRPVEEVFIAEGPWEEGVMFPRVAFHSRGKPVYIEWKDVLDVEEHEKLALEEGHGNCPSCCAFSDASHLTLPSGSDTIIRSFVSSHGQLVAGLAELPSRIAKIKADKKMETY